MRKLVVPCAALLGMLVVGPNPARAAGLDLTWNACNTDGGVEQLMFSCANPLFQAQLVGCFQLPADMDSLVGMEISLDLEVEAAALPAFWELGVSQCNATGLTLSLAAPLVGCTGIPNVWGAGGVEGDGTRAYLSAYGGRASRGRLVASLFRLGGDPVDVTAETNMFAFNFLLSTANAAEAGGACAGCETPAVIVWNSADIHSVAVSQPDPVTLIDPGLTGRCVRINAADPGTCAATPTRNQTWGRLKSLYR